MVTVGKIRKAAREPFGRASVDWQSWSFPSIMGLAAIFGAIVTIFGFGVASRPYLLASTAGVAALSLLSFAVLGRPRKAPERSPQAELDLFLNDPPDDDSAEPM